MKKVKKILIEYWPYLTAVLAITLPWLLKSGYLFFTDYSVGSKIDLDWQNQYFIINLGFKAFSFFLPIDLIQKMFISLSFFIVLLGAKKIISNFIEDRWLIFCLSLFALYNPFVYDRLGYGQIGIIFAMGLLALSFGYLLKFLDAFDYKQLIWGGISLGFTILFAMHFVFIAVPFYLLFLILAYFKRKNIKLLKFSLFFLAMMLIVILINANWLSAFFTGASSTSRLVSQGISEADYYAFQTSGETGPIALKNVLMMSGFWGKEAYRYYDLADFKQNWGISFLLLLPLMLWGIISGIKNKKYRGLSIGLLIIFIISTVLAVGIRLPIAREISFFLFNHLPFYKGLRESQKWVAAIVIIYLIFITIGAKQLFSIRLIDKNKFSRLLIGTIMILQAPLLIWGMQGQKNPANYPPDWQEINQYIIQNGNCQSRNLFLPWHLYMGFKFAGSVTANPAPRFFTCPTFSGTNMEYGGIYDNSQNPNSQAISQWLEQKGKTSLFADLNIKYVILATEEDWQSYLWLDDLPELQKIQTTNNLILYQVKNAK